MSRFNGSRSPIRTSEDPLYPGPKMKPNTSNETLAYPPSYQYKPSTDPLYPQAPKAVAVGRGGGAVADWTPQYPGEPVPQAQPMNAGQRENAAQNEGANAMGAQLSQIKQGKDYQAAAAILDAKRKQYGDDHASLLNDADYKKAADSIGRLTQPVYNVGAQTRRQVRNEIAQNGSTALGADRQIQNEQRGYAADANQRANDQAMQQGMESDANIRRSDAATRQTDAETKEVAPNAQNQRNRNTAETGLTAQQAWGKYYENQQIAPNAATARDRVAAETQQIGPDAQSRRAAQDAATQQIAPDAASKRGNMDAQTKAIQDQAASWQARHDEQKKRADDLEKQIGELRTLLAKGGIDPAQAGQQGGAQQIPNAPAPAAPNSGPIVSNTAGAGRQGGAFNGSANPLQPGAGGGNQPMVGQRKRNPQTGQVIEWDGKQWVLRP